MTQSTYRLEADSGVEMSNRRELQKEAYRYIRERLYKLRASSDDADQPLTISIDELRLLKEGITDPSTALVAALKQLFRDTVTEAEIYAHLVAPFEKQGDEGEANSARRGHH